MVEQRILRPGDEAPLELFLQRHAATSLFLRSNLREAGLVDRGAFLQGTYAARIEGGVMTDVVGHFWNGRLILQAPNAGADLARLAMRAANRQLNGLIGPWDQVVRFRRGLGLQTAPVTLDSREDLFALDLAQLRVPTILSTGEVGCRRSREEDLSQQAAWRVSFNVETMGSDRSTAVVRACEEAVSGAHQRGHLFVLERAGEVVATAAFNASVPDCVQVGGVWTPPQWRGLGFARAVVAGALLEVRPGGVTRSVLFTGETNHPARRAYESLGFMRVGDYGIVAFAGAHG